MFKIPEKLRRLFLAFKSFNVMSDKMPDVLKLISSDSKLSGTEINLFNSSLERLPFLRFRFRIE